MPSKKQLIFFSAEWCGPCKKMKEIVNKIILEFKELELKIIDCDARDDLAGDFKVRSLPTFVILEGTSINSIDANKGEKSRKIGGCDALAFKQWLVDNECQ